MDETFDEVNDSHNKTPQDIPTRHNQIFNEIDIALRCWRMNNILNVNTEIRKREHGNDEPEKKFQHMYPIISNTL